MKLAALRCGGCGKERFVRERDRGSTVACDGCGAAIEVPESLAFPEYTELLGDRNLALRLEIAICVSFLFCCLPASAGTWWFTSGAIQRSIDEARPVDPTFLRVRAVARVTTILQILVWTFAGWSRF